MPSRVALTIVLLFTLLVESAGADETTTAASPASETAAATAASSEPKAAAPTKFSPTPPMPAINPPAQDATRTAVALNYCRASFHRIRRYPINVVLAEEQEKILNNINLNGVLDREVIQLYTSVLDEIHQIPMADFERRLADQYYSTLIQRKIVWDVLSIGADVANQHYGDAIRTGVNSWWDYRVLDYQHDTDLLRIDKARLNSVFQKSAQFLDTFWQMAQRKNIPDRWLVRGDDLDALDQAMREPNPEVRLRVLKRMEPFMEAYPPYWYYVARTQQELGQLFAALNTYTKVAALGEGYFRKDDMLATALANKAAIQDYLQQPSAARTAEQALTHSTDVWESNLICAQVLAHDQRFADAEDAILRNLDVQLETRKSRVMLVSLYGIAGERDKLLRQLSDPQIVALIPPPVLLRCSYQLGAEATPPHVLRAVVDSLEAWPRVQFGRDDFILRASSSWMLNVAAVRVFHQGVELKAQEVTAGNGYHQFRFTPESDWGNPLDSSARNSGFELSLVYPDRTTLRLALGPESELAGRSTGFPSAARAVTARMTGGPTLRIAQIIVADDPSSGLPPVSDLPADKPSAGAGVAGTPVSAADIPLPPRTAE